ncbi:MAG: hypothetical protein AMXMBFR51_20980 [Ignavibacteriota bacterium]
MKQAYPTLSDYYKLESSLDLPPELRQIKQYFDLVSKPLKSRNSRLVGHFITRTTALSSFDWHIINDQNNEITQRCKQSINQLINQHCFAVLFGVSAYQLLPIVTDSGSVISVSRLNNSDYDYDNDSIHFYKNGKYQYTANIDDNSLLLDKIDYLDKGGLMRTIMPMEIIRFDIVLEYANYLRKLKGILQIVDKGSTPESQSNAEFAAKSAINHNYVITDDFLEFRLNSITAANGNSFKDFIDLLNKEIAIAVLGQANTSELPNYGGSRAALQVLKLVSADIMYSDMIRVENLINKFLEIDFKVNYGTGKPDYKFQFIFSQEQDFEANASAIRQIIDIIPLKKDEVYAKIGFTPPANEDDLFKGFQQ